MILALESGFTFFDAATGAIERLAVPEWNLPESRFNDSKYDRRGRFWSGTTTEAPPHSIASTRDLFCHRVEGEIGISNSLPWSTGDHVLCFADTREGTVRIYNFDIVTEATGNRRVFATAGQSGFPDGSTVDAEVF